MNKERQYQKLSLAIKLASAEHCAQYDKSGKPYILHCLHVMNTVKSKDPEVKQIAVMHDLIEDTDLNADILRNQYGFSERVVNVLKLLTRDKDQPYGLYIADICTNRDAMLVKMADLRHNSDITRLKGISDKDIIRMQKYHKSYITIKEALKNHAIGVNRSYDG